MTTPLRQAIERFHVAQQARREDVRDPQRADALRQARQALDAEAAELRRRLPFRLRPLGAGHLAVLEEVALHDGPRYRGHTLCGADPGRRPRGTPAPCTGCLLTAERFLIEGPPPLELGL